MTSPCILNYRRNLRRFFVLIAIPFILAGCEQKPQYQPVQKGVIQSERVPAPAFEVKTLDGKTVSLDDLKGKVVFLDFWATWCPPCVISSPEVDRMASDYTGQDVHVLSVSVDNSADVVKDFIDARNLHGNFAMAGNSQIDAKFNITSLPAFFIIDKKGYIVGAWRGYHPAMVVAWRAELDRLLNA